jgi:beta-lactamase class A
MLYGARLLVFGVGVSILAGTMLSIWDPASHPLAGPNPKDAKVAEVKPADTLALGQELGDLKGKIVSLVAQQKQSKAGVMLLDLDNNAYVDLNASEVFPAASTIKFPVLVAFFQDVDAGKISLAEMLTMESQQVAKESGTMQYQPVGTKFTALETATQMMVVSDNTATNMLIERLGGMPALNQRFKTWGLNVTTLNNVLPDVKATNTTSPKDLAFLMSQVQRGQLISLKSRDRLMYIMQRIENDSLLPQGLGKGATIAHKTGTLGTLLGDVGLVDMPSGKRYLAAVLVQRPRDDVGAEKLVQEISREAYQRFNQTQDASQNFKRPRIAQPPN